LLVYVVASNGRCQSCDVMAGLLYRFMSKPVANACLTMRRSASHARYTWLERKDTRIQTRSTPTYRCMNSRNLLCSHGCKSDNNNNNNNNLGRRLSLISDDARETSHLFQQVSVLIQRYNAVAFRGSFIEEDDDVSG